MQTPAKFDYTRATSLEDAIATLSRLGMGARVIAGGQSLLPMMKLRLANVEHLVDINDLEDQLNYIRVEGDEIRIGAMARHVDILKSDVLREHYPVFHDAEMVIADPIVRNRGTMGGSLCQADAAEDLSAVCEAAKATVVVRGPSGERTIDINDFHLGPYMTAVQDGEILTEVRLRLHSGAGSAHFKVERRAGDWAIVAAAACLWLDNGVIVDAGIALSAVGLTTIHASQAEEYLRGKAPSETVFAEAGRLAAGETSPSADGRGPVEYKRHLANVLTQRSLTLAAERAMSSTPVAHPGHTAPAPLSAFLAGNAGSSAPSTPGFPQASAGTGPDASGPPSPSGGPSTISWPR